MEKNNWNFINNTLYKCYKNKILKLYEVRSKSVKVSFYKPANDKKATK